MQPGNINEKVFFEPLPNSFSLGDLGDLAIDVGVTMWYRVHRLNDAPFNETTFKNLELYVTKYISYNDQNFLLFIGLNLSNLDNELLNIKKNVIIRNIFHHHKGTIRQDDIDSNGGKFKLINDSNSEVTFSVGNKIIISKNV